MCDRVRCNEKCQKLLKCGHFCIGVCGESCPNICRRCLSPQKFQSLVFGKKRYKHTKYVLLEDCQHVVEVDFLDEWMDKVIEEGEIKWKCCPKCFAPVIKTARYSNIAKRILNDLNEIKIREQNLLTSDNRMTMRLALSSIPVFQLEIKGIVSKRACDQWEGVVSRLSDFGLQRAYLNLFSAFDVLIIKHELENMVSSRLPLNYAVKMNFLLWQATDFIGWIRKHRDMLTEQMIIDIKAERIRILLLGAMYKLLYTIRIEEDELQFFTKLSAYETDGSKIQKFTDDAMNEIMVRQLQGILNKYRVPLNISEERYTTFCITR